MRPTPTQAERLAIEALLDAYRADGHEVHLPPRDFHDKPDLLVEVSGFLVACECTQLPSSYIFQNMYKRGSPDRWRGKDVLSMVWPNEPHQWVVEAIKKKSKLVPSYLQSTAAKEAWLLLHSPVEMNQAFISSDLEWTKWALRHGCKMVRHPFSKVFLWTPQYGLQTVSTIEHEADTHSEFGIDFARGYPTICVNQFRAIFRTRSRDTGDSVTYTYRHFSSTLEIVEPVDPMYAANKPAVRGLAYETAITAWAERASVRSVAIFNDGSEDLALSMELSTLLPETEYTFHALHEVRAPRFLNTLHRVQAR